MERWVATGADRFIVASNPFEKELRPMIPFLMQGTTDNLDFESWGSRAAERHTHVF